MNKMLKFGVLAASLSLAACASPQHQYTATGAAIGGVTGAVVGHQINGKNGRYVGGALGALIGAAVGNNADQIQNRGYRQQPAYESSGYNNDPDYRNSNNRYDEDDRYDDNGGYAKYPRNRYNTY